MGNRWLKIIEENTTTFANHTEYTTPDLSMDWVDFNMELDQGSSIEATSGRAGKRYHWFGPMNGTTRINSYMAGDNIGIFLKSIYGTAAAKTNDGSGHYKHMFTEAEEPPAFTVYDYDSDLSDYRKSQGNVLTSLSLDFPARGVSAYTAEYLYADEAVVATPPSMPSLPTVRPFQYYDAYAAIGGAEITRAESFRLNFRRSIPEDSHTLNHRDRQYLIAEGIEVTADIDIQLTDWSYLKKYYGTADPGAPADEDQTLNMSFVVVGPSLGGAGAYSNYKLVLHQPAMVITGHRATKTRRDRKMETVSLESIYNASQCMFLWDDTVTYVAS